jgi:hypothetical protein
MNAEIVACHLAWLEHQRKACHELAGATTDPETYSRMVEAGSVYAEVAAEFRLSFGLAAA